MISYSAGFVNFGFDSGGFRAGCGIIVGTWGTIRLRPNLLHHHVLRPQGAFFELDIMMI